MSSDGLLVVDASHGSVPDLLKSGASVKMSAAFSRVLAGTDRSSSEPDGSAVRPPSAPIDATTFVMLSSRGRAVRS